MNTERMTDEEVIKALTTTVWAGSPAQSARVAELALKGLAAEKQQALDRDQDRWMQAYCAVLSGCMAYSDGEGSGCDRGLARAAASRLADDAVTDFHARWGR